MNDCAIARQQGLPRTTVRDMRRSAARSPSRPLCPRCWRTLRPLTIGPDDYSLLLGIYLGDGDIAELARTKRLRISLDAKYPRIIEKTAELLRRCFSGNSVIRQSRYEGRMAIVSVYHQHLDCLLPQHGPGPKNSRTIALEPWQEGLVEMHPWSVLKGLLWTDGCSFVNRTGKYAYPSYQFVNTSEGIVDIFLDACKRVGVKARVTFSITRRSWDIRINRRECVALIDAHIGPKA